MLEKPTGMNEKIDCIMRQGFIAWKKTTTTHWKGQEKVCKRSRKSIQGCRVGNWHRGVQQREIASRHKSDAIHSFYEIKNTTCRHKMSFFRCRLDETRQKFMNFQLWRFRLKMCGWRKDRDSRGRLLFVIISETSPEFLIISLRSPKVLKIVLTSLIHLKWQYRS